MMSKPFPKVLIYGAGRHGQEAAWIAHDLGWDVVGVYNRAGDKVGQDIGEVRDGKTPIGVAVEDCEKVDFSKLNVDLAFVAMTDRLANNIQEIKVTVYLSGGMFRPPVFGLCIESTVTKVLGIKVTV